jgi:hypothetical protein
VAKEKIDELDIQAVVRPGGHHGHSGSQDASRRDDVPEHYYQCAALSVLLVLEAKRQMQTSGSNWFETQHTLFSIVSVWHACRPEMASIT